MPYAVGESVLDVAGFKLRCYQLNDGRRVFNADDVQAFFAQADDDAFRDLAACDRANDGEGENV